MKVHTRIVLDLASGEVLEDRWYDYEGPVAQCLTSSSDTSSSPAPLSPEELRLMNISGDIGDEQLKAIRAQSGFQGALFGASGTNLDQMMSGLNAPQDAMDSEVQGLQLGNIRAGGAATPEDISLIDESANQALTSGASDIQSFYKNSLNDLRESLAPSLGFQPGDSPILDRGGKLATEAMRQYGQLVASTRGAAAQQKLQFPVQRASAVNTMADSFRQFQQSLKQQAFANRSTLLGSTGNLGLGLATGLKTQTPQVPRSTSTSTSDPFAAAGGIGSLMMGMALL